MDKQKALDALAKIKANADEVIAALNETTTPPVDPGMQACPRGPTIFKMNSITQDGVDFNWDGEGVGELSLYLMQNGSVLESFEKMKMTSNLIKLSWKSRKPGGDYQLKIAATQCKGEDTKTFTIKGDVVVTPPVTPVDPTLQVCPRGPTIFKMNAFTSTGVNFNWDGDGVGELSMYLMQNGQVLERFEKMPMTSNLIVKSWSKSYPAGKYDLKIQATKCKGEDTKTFEITGGTTPDPKPEPEPDPKPVSGNEIPEPTYSDPTKLNVLDLDAIPAVDVNKDSPYKIVEIELPYGAVLPKGRKKDLILKHAQSVSAGIAWSEDEMRAGASAPKVGEASVMKYQQNVVPWDGSNVLWDQINWDHVKQSTADIINQANILANNMGDGKNALMCLMNDLEWPGAFGDGSNRDRAVYVFLARVFRDASKNSQAIYSGYVQAPLMSWGRSSIDQYEDSARNGAYFTPVQREAVLEKTGYPEELYGKSIADIFGDNGTSAHECYPLYEDRFPDGYQVRDKNGKGLNTPWGPFITKRNNDWARHWVANFAGAIEANKKKWPHYKMHVNLGLYNLGGSGYEMRPYQLDGTPDYWQPKLNQGDPNDDAWALHRPVSKFHARGFSALGAFMGININTLWCNSSGTTKTTPVEWDGTMHEDDQDFRPYEYFYRERVRIFNTAVTIDGQTYRMKDIMDGSEEYLRDNTECRYSGLTKKVDFKRKGDGTYQDTGDGRGTAFTLSDMPEGTFLKLKAPERKILQTPFVYQVVNRSKRLIATLGIKGYTSDIDTTITTRFEGKEINSFKLRDDQVMIRIDRY